jgi:SAM-dependent methyltransferase
LLSYSANFHNIKTIFYCKKSFKVAFLPILIFMHLPDIHLDIGCGKVPRNPYSRQKLCGVDLDARVGDLAQGFDFQAANLALEPIPYPSNTFGSVSAFDFIEHVPRILVTADGRETFFPFIRLMDEIWRVLAHGGRLYALTPAFPRLQAFVDPTHVNFITEGTHEYFCGEFPFAHMYGFAGRFNIIRAHWVHHHEAVKASFDSSTDQQASNVLHQKKSRPLIKRIADMARNCFRVLRGRPISQSSDAALYGVHFLWELEAVKV